MQDLEIHISRTIVHDLCEQSIIRSASSHTVTQVTHSYNLNTSLARGKGSRSKNNSFLGWHSDDHMLHSCLTFNQVLFYFRSINEVTIMDDHSVMSVDLESQIDLCRRKLDLLKDAKCLKGWFLALKVGVWTGEVPCSGLRHGPYGQYSMSRINLLC